MFQSTASVRLKIGRSLGAEKKHTHTCARTRTRRTRTSTIKVMTLFQTKPIYHVCQRHREARQKKKRIPSKFSLTSFSNNKKMDFMLMICIWSINLFLFDLTFNGLKIHLHKLIWWIIIKKKILSTSHAANQTREKKTRWIHNNSILCVCFFADLKIALISSHTIFFPFRSLIEKEIEMQINCFILMDEYPKKNPATKTAQ